MLFSYAAAWFCGRCWLVLILPFFLGIVHNIVGTFDNGVHQSSYLSYSSTFTLWYLSSFIIFVLIIFFKMVASLSFRFCIGFASLTVKVSAAKIVVES